MSPFNLLRSLLRPRVETEETVFRRLDGLAGHRHVATAPPVSVFSAPRRGALRRDARPFRAGSFGQACEQQLTPGG
jgi:hypothetical protein